MNRIQFPLIAKRAPIATTMFAFVLVFAGFANAGAMSLFHTHKAKKGYLTITAPTEVGGTVLQPGEYEVRQAKSPSGPVIEFVQQFRNELASELVQAGEEKVAARLKFTERELGLPSKQTQLMLASWYSTDAVGVEIRGNAVGFMFDPPAAKVGAMVASTNAGQHE